MFSSSDEHLIEAVYKKHGFDTAVGRYSVVQFSRE